MPPYRRAAPEAINNFKECALESPPLGRGAQGAAAASACSPICRSRHCFWVLQHFLHDAKYSLLSGIRRHIFWIDIGLLGCKY